jgi:parallel beta-helix repeat protein
VSSGIVCHDSCHIEGNVVFGNGGAGMDISGGTVLGNTIFRNGSYGISGTVGFGNNTLVFNNADAGGVQINGTLFELHPNSCLPVAC